MKQDFQNGTLKRLGPSQNPVEFAIDIEEDDITAFDDAVYVSMVEQPDAESSGSESEEFNIGSINASKK